ncbi:ATP-binding protein [Roseibacterium beibuensis]|uniref:sensor histidine kinase n=1 Tax=[Roseibacterium] beibuensis TaxID=1193142 RepID=UPI00217D1FC9|nr:ATP-binding protein [Roseibacterium beibuensis]MCS6622563.1 ATP-binding protein [Roseibacterium beibuensis]
MRRFFPGDAGQWRIFAAVWLALAVLAVLIAGEAARRDAETSALRQASTAGALHAAVLRSELERHRSLPLVLAQDPDLLALLESPDPKDIDRLNRKFERLARESRAAAIYALDANGVALAASNWREPTSFVGSDYRFRPYHFEAMREGQAAFFALGTVSGRPGLYLSRRVDDATGRPLGVIVAKVEFDALEAEWRKSGEPTYVADANGVVLITTVPEWRFHTTRPLSPAERRRLAAEQTAGAAVLTDMPFPVRPSGLVRVGENIPSGLYASAADALPDIGWTVHLLAPAGEAIARAVAVARMLALLSVALLAGVTGILLRRRQRAAIRAVEAEAARVDLEQRIDARTAELRAANTRLNHEIEERRRAEKSRQNLQDELIQANKLATLGQIAAGVAHEINQPIAAIRTHADTAGLYLEAQDGPAARRSLDSIAGLTERVGAITDELRAFSRKTRSETVAVGVEAAIDGALLLVGARMRERGVALIRKPGTPGLAVMAERNRLEQVLLNLLQNATEALRDTADPTITLDIQSKGRRVTIRISDNGPGVAPEVRDRLFTPFTTDKRDGVGLGLVISRDIVAGFGGELSLEPTPRGATFVIRLTRAS